MYPKIYIGTMSLTIVDMVIKFNQDVAPIGLISSRRQIDWWGGYVNHWTTQSFTQYVRGRDSFALLCRDHGGPKQGTTPELLEDDGRQSLLHDCNWFNIIHIDPWKDCKSIEEGIQNTCDLLNSCYATNPEMQYEIGTEEAIYPMTVEELNVFLSGVKKKVIPQVFSRIIYAVIQSGTRLLQGKNIGLYDPNRLEKMINVVRSYGIMTKEHNGDWIAPEQIRDKFRIGMDAINIAPEFGQIESEAYLHFLEGDLQFKHDLFWLCYNSNRWRKWVSNDYKPVDESGKIIGSIDDLIKICGHYVLSHPLCSLITSKYPQIHDMARQKIWDKLTELRGLYP